jgi:hypothetical protein
MIQYYDIIDDKSIHFSKSPERRGIVLSQGYGAGLIKLSPV